MYVLVLQAALHSSRWVRGYHDLDLLHTPISNNNKN
jgi:hypothetical protein